MTKKVAEERLKWCGHVKRRDEEHILRRMLSPAYIHATVRVYDATQPSRTNPFTTGPRTLPRRYPDLAILPSHLTDRKYLRAHSQAQVTPQKAFSPDATTK